MSANSEEAWVGLEQGELRAAGDMLEIAIKEGSLRMMSTMIGLPWTKHIDDERWSSLLVLCAQCENPKMLELVLSSRVDWSAALEDGRALTEALRRDQAECVELLAKAGADLEGIFRDGEGEKHLVGAVKSRCWRSAEKLVELGADIDAGRPGGLLTRAIECSQLSLLEKLLDAGADPDKRPLVGRSPLEALAMVYKQHGCSAAMLERLLKAGVDVDSASLTGMTALMCAAKLDVAPMVARLLAAGADPWRVDREGDCALFMAANRGSEAAALVMLEAAPPKTRGDWVELSICASNRLMPKFSAAIAARIESFDIDASAEGPVEKTARRLLRM